MTSMARRTAAVVVALAVMACAIRFTAEVLSGVPSIVVGIVAYGL